LFLAGPIPGILTQLGIGCERQLGRNELKAMRLRGWILPVKSLTYCLLLLFATLPLQAEPEFQFKTDWRGERIELPPGFAPELGWNGVEEIRFAPGMFEPGTESFFSYVLVFLLEEGSDVSPESIQREVLTYYQGLAKAVMGNTNRPVDTSQFDFALGDPKTSGDTTEFTGQLNWVEPFATQQPQKLNLEISLWKHLKQPALFFSVSPQPADHAIWTKLREIREDFQFQD